MLELVFQLVLLSALELVLPSASELVHELGLLSAFELVLLSAL